jgi:hypothetical protein
MMRFVATKTIMRVALAASTMLATPVLAQQAAPVPAPDAPVAAPETAAAPAPGRDIIVTGSRITSGGFSAPTPTQVLGADAIAKNAQPNIFTTVAQLPR